MAEYKVTKVSEQKPREWEGPHGTVYYIKVMLEGHNRPVSIGKKSANALKAGDTVYGTITPDPNFEEDKFKPDQKPNSPGGGFGGGARKEYVDHHEDIKAEWAIGLALNAIADKNDLEAVESLARDLHGMVERVKDGRGADESKPKVEQRGSGEVVIPYDDDEPVNLDDIPF